MRKSRPQPQRWYKVNDLVPHRIFPGTRNTLLTWIEHGRFPKPIKMDSSTKTTRRYTLMWPVEVVDEWVENLKATHT